MSKQLYDKIKQTSEEQGLEKLLGELELAVMEIVWAREPVTVRDVLTVLQEGGRNLAYTTVMTVMRRLTEKGWLDAVKQGRAYEYRAVRPRDEATAEAVGEIMRALLQDFGDVTVARFVQELDAIAPDQLDRLAQLAQNAREDRDADQ